MFKFCKYTFKTIIHSNWTDLRQPWSNFLYWSPSYSRHPISIGISSWGLFEMHWRIAFVYPPSRSYTLQTKLCLTWIIKTLFFPDISVLQTPINFIHYNSPFQWIIIMGLQCLRSTIGPLLTSKGSGRWDVGCQLEEGFQSGLESVQVPRKN